MISSPYKIETLNSACMQRKKKIQILLRDKLDLS
jgi:hypothetical protein